MVSAKRIKEMLSEKKKQVRMETPVGRAKRKGEMDAQIKGLKDKLDEIEWYTPGK